MASSCFSTGREMLGLQVKAATSQGAEPGLFPAAVVSLELYHLLHQDFTDWIDFSSGHRESQPKRKCMLSLNHVTKQDTPAPQLQATFGKGWSHPVVLNAKSDKKIAGLRLRSAGGLSRGPLRHYFIALRQCRAGQKMHTVAGMHLETITVGKR